MHISKLCTLYKSYQLQVNQKSFGVTGVNKRGQITHNLNDKSNSVNVLVLGKHA